MPGGSAAAAGSLQDDATGTFHGFEHDPVKLNELVSLMTCLTALQQVRTCQCGKATRGT